MISQITPAGLRPARRARSTRGLGLARCARAPRRPWPSAGRRGRAGRGRAARRPGRSRPGSCGRGRGAEMPVVTPSRASIETVNAVSNGDSFLAAIRSRPSSSQRSGVSARQISPRPSLAMKLIASGVANCAASVRSPSFSRSSSSQTTTILPCADVLDRLLDRRERACAVLRRSPAADQPLDVLRQHVHLQVDAGPARPRRASCARASRGSARRVKPSSSSSGDGERDAVDRDRALLDDVAQQAGLGGDRHDAREARPRAPPPPSPSAVDVALDDVAAEPVGGAQRQLEVDRRAGPSAPSEERRSVSSITSAAKRPSSIAVAVRQTPLTAIESPVAELRGERRRRRAGAPRRRSRSTASTVPRSWPRAR